MSTQDSSRSRFPELAQELERRLDPLVEKHWKRLRAHLPDWVLSDPVARQRIREFSRDSAATQLRCFRIQELPERCPEVDTQVAHEVARLKMRLDPVLTGYRLGHRGTWEEWLELVEGRIEDGRERRELLERASRFLFDYTDRITALVTNEYESERDRVLRNPDRRRLHLVRDLLEGAEVDSESLGWELEHHHIGMLAWAEGGDTAAGELAEALGRPLLLVETSVEGTWWGWCSGSAPLSAESDQLIAKFRPLQGRLAIGLEAHRAAGFRLTHRQASRAGWVAWYTDLPVTRFADVALEGLSIEDPESARSFVANELDGLDDDSPRSVRLRKTLRAYFKADHNAASAAASLGVHQQTVANRIRAAEDQLGSQVAHRRGELELALRLHRCLERPPSLRAGLQNEGYLP